GRRVDVDLLEELDAFRVTVPRHALPDQSPFQHIHRGEQCGGAVPLVVMGHRFATAGIDWQALLGAVSRAWIWLFSSTQSTKACSGGSRYRPTKSRSFSAKWGSLLTLKVRHRCGFNPLARQTRLTRERLVPSASARVRVLQLVALAGFCWVVISMIRRTRS